MEEEEEYYEYTVEELQEIRAGIKEEIFEIKQFIIGKAPIYKLFKSRIHRVDELAQIQKVLFPEEVIEMPTLPETKVFEGTHLKTIFNTYFVNKNVLKQRFFASKSLDELSALMEKMCENEKTFADLFDLPNREEGKIVSKELDPMEILHSIDEAEKIGIQTIEDIRNEVNELPYMLNGEIKRLLLLSRRF